MDCPSPDIVDTYFERDIFNDEIRYQCILCRGRTMKDTTRHKALLNHRLAVASHKNEIDEDDVRLARNANKLYKAMCEDFKRTRSNQSSFKKSSSDHIAEDTDVDGDERMNETFNEHMNEALNSSSEFGTRESSCYQESLKDQSSPSPGSSHTTNTAVSSINSPMAPEDRAKWEQVAGLFDLNPTSREQALKISSITGDNNRYHALVCLMHQLQQDFAKQHSGNYSNHWKPSQDLGPELMKMMRLILRCHTIESYSISDTQTDLIEGSFHEKAMQALNSKSNAWKSEYLPPNFATSSEDKTNHETFISLFKDKLRDILEEFRLILLTHIYTPTKKLEDPVLPVPNIVALQGLLFRFFDENDLRTDDEINAQIEPKAALRFAYLRLEVVEHHLTIPINRRGGPESSPWSCVDALLPKLCEKDRVYQRAFGVLIHTRDEGFFDGRFTVNCTKKRYRCRVPTDQEIESLTRNWRCYAY